MAKTKPFQRVHILLSHSLSKSIKAKQTFARRQGIFFSDLICQFFFLFCTYVIEISSISQLRTLNNSGIQEKWYKVQTVNKKESVGLGHTGKYTLDGIVNTSINAMHLFILHVICLIMKITGIVQQPKGPYLTHPAKCGAQHFAGAPGF